MLDPSTPQRDLRTPIPARASSRVAASTEHQATVAAHLTERDRWIARMCAEHRTLTSTQIVQVAFPTRRAANYRLQRLYQWRVLDRFQPYVGKGRSPMFYVLDTTGAHLLAHEDGIDPRLLGFRAERSIGIAYSLRLAHLHGLNSLFTGLIADALAQGDREVTAWWSEARCARHFGDIVRPDGYGRWREDDREIEWFLEWDTGRAPLGRFVAKVPDYLELAASSRIVTPLLAVFSTAGREAHARRLLTQHLRSQPRPQDVPIATTTTEELNRTGTASASIWLPLAHRDAGRWRLADLHAAWPHVGEPTSSTQATPSARETSPVPRLSPPAPMPPFAHHDLTWKPTG
ncbi:replication-relaxation family protein [Pseudonocardia sp. C8]|uniref:Replication-relaxation family protein n=1 Tax=Saccharopolyspora cebuensis TaxID=418759 RepID=A0ABV4CRI9_9PSEU|nr:replication-relaxation family protein [Pseudonocardia sp. C8]MBC3194058.1 replication-relaxation family protein [Pseudonocardia sp. C8]